MTCLRTHGPLRDAIQVPAFAIEETESTVFMEIAGTLRFLKDWDGVVGAYDFVRAGFVQSHWPIGL